MPCFYLFLPLIFRLLFAHREKNLRRMGFSGASEYENHHSSSNDLRYINTKSQVIS